MAGPMALLKPCGDQMGLVAVLVGIYFGGPLGALFLLIGVVQLVRKKKSAANWLVFGTVLIVIAALLAVELSKVNFGL